MKCLILTLNNRCFREYCTDLNHYLNLEFVSKMFTLHGMKRWTEDQYLSQLKSYSSGYDSYKVFCTEERKKMIKSFFKLTGYKSKVDEINYNQYNLLNKKIFHLQNSENSSNLVYNYDKKKSGYLGLFLNESKISSRDIKYKSEYEMKNPIYFEKLSDKIGEVVTNFKNDITTLTTIYMEVPSIIETVAHPYRTKEQSISKTPMVTHTITTIGEILSSTPNLGIDSVLSQYIFIDGDSNLPINCSDDYKNKEDIGDERPALMNSSSTLKYANKPVVYSILSVTLGLFAIFCFTNTGNSDIYNIESHEDNKKVENINEDCSLTLPVIIPHSQDSLDESEKSFKENKNSF